MKKNLIAVLLSVGISSLSYGQNMSNEVNNQTSAISSKPKVCKPWQAHRKKMLLKKLPQEQRSLFFETMAAAKIQARPLHQEIHQIKKELKQLLTSQEFDENAFTDKSAEIGPKKKELARIKQAAVIKLGNSFDQNERNILAKVLKIKCHRGHKGRQQS